MQDPASLSAAGVPTIQKPEHRMAAHIRDAAETTGVPFDFLLAQANQESQLDPDARNSKSSATGLFQFTSGTWLEMIYKHGADHGLGNMAQLVSRGADGRYSVKDKEARKQILDLRRDPKLSSLMAGEYAKDNQKYLQSKLGRDVSTRDLYLAHFLGAGGALKVLKGLAAQEIPTTVAQNPDLVQAANANPDVFKDPNSGEHRSMEEIYQAVGRRFRRAMADAASVSKTLRPQVDLAAIRPQSRPEDQSESVTATDQPSAIEAEAVDLAHFGTFPVSLPPRPAANQPASQSFPVALPPPLSSTRADAATMQQLLQATERSG